MHNPACYPLEHFCFFICESSPLETGTEPAEWSDTEIAYIRAVLQKLTTIRVFNATDAEDLVQDTLLTMITKHPGLELRKGLLVWTMGVLRKKVGNYYRKAQRFTALNEELLTRGAIESSAMASPEAQLCFAELQEIVQEELAALPAAQRQAMELLIAGFDPGEIVRELHPESYQNVINRIYRGRKKLAKALASYGYGPGSGSGLRKMKRCRGKRI